MRATWFRGLCVALSLAAVSACSDDSSDDPEPDAAPPLFPDNYRDTYTMVRDCRASTSHEFHKILVWADPTATVPYLERQEPFPVGAILLKEEFDFADTACEDEVLRRTVMKRLPEGEGDPDHLGWLWQDLEPTGEVVSVNDSLCYACHDDCDGDPTGSYENTCAVP